MNKLKSLFIKIGIGFAMLMLVTSFTLSVVSISANLGRGNDPVASAYVGYDGYLWVGSERTNLQVEELDTDVAESTLSLYENEYFNVKQIDLTNKILALTGNYFSKIQKTGYSGTYVSEVSIYCTKSGTLEIGTAKIGGQVTNSTQYNVEKGLNTLQTNLQVADDETIVFGGDATTVGLYYVSDIDDYDEFGLFTTFSDTLSSDFENSKSNGTDNKLICEIKASVLLQTGEVEQLTPDYEEFFATDSGYTYSTVVLSSTSAPFLFSSSVYGGKHLTRIGIPILGVESLESDAVMSFYVVDESYEIVDTYKVKIPVESINEVTWTYNSSSSGYNTYTAYSTVEEVTTYTFKFIYVDVDIYIPKGCYFGNGCSTDTASMAFIGTASSSNYPYYYPEFQIISNDGTRRSQMWTLDAYGADYTEAETFSEHLATLAEENGDEFYELKSLLEGKNVSILGDSISTYAYISNNAYKTNSTIGSNSVYYSSSNLDSSDDTWWAKTVSDLNMNLLVNNSYSGARVYSSDSSAGYLRADQLHDDTGSNAGTNPDIIFIYMGINDFDGSVESGSFDDIDFGTLIQDNLDGTFTYATPANFAEAYAIMVHKAVSTYGADVFCMTLLPNKVNTDIDTLLVYNEIITKIAEKYGCGLVDLYSDSGITSENYTSYMVDSKCLHPNADGMALMATCLENAMKNYYLG